MSGPGRPRAVAIRRLIPILGAVAMTAGCGAASDDTTRNPAGPKPAPVRPTMGAGEILSKNPKEARFLGLVAPKPATWIEHPSATKMRAANFTVPGREGSEAAHIVVFYFGPTEGGTVQENIVRWQQQFKRDENGRLIDARIETLQADGMQVTLVELAGDWMKMGSDWYTPDQLFLAAVIESPSGNIYIRFAGDTATVEGNRDDFYAMIRGVRKE